MPLIVDPVTMAALMPLVVAPPVTATVLAELCEALLLYHWVTKFPVLPHPVANETS